MSKTTRRLLSVNLQLRREANKGNADQTAHTSQYTQFRLQQLKAHTAVPWSWVHAYRLSCRLQVCLEQTCIRPC